MAVVDARRDDGMEAEATAPSVTIVFLVFNRREELRESLKRMVEESGYPRDRLEVVVVDNASTDGSAEMVRAEFPEAKVITHPRNVGVSGFNAGFAAAQGEWVLALDDDCYLPPGGLGRALAEARARDADLVSFKVVSTANPGHVFTQEFRTGLLGFWGCAVLVRTPVLKELEGYDPQMFIDSNETEFMIRFLDGGHRHLHLPDVAAQHMKKPYEWKPPAETDMRVRYNTALHYGYTAAKLLQPQDAIVALLALVTTELRDGVRVNWRCTIAAPRAVRGFLRGLRHRRPVRPEVSDFYRRNFWPFAGPWAFSRPLGELIRAAPRELASGRMTEYRPRPEPTARYNDYFANRGHVYPDGPAVLQL